MRSIALRAATGATAVVAALCTMTGGAAADDPKPGAPSGFGIMSTVPYVTISSTGPLSAIHLGNELSCQVNISTAVSSALLGFGGGGQAYGPAYEPADCGTFLAYGGTLYGPDFSGHTSTAATPMTGLGYQAFIPVSQTPVTGSGTVTNPYIVTTVVDAGASGIRLTRIDTYVTGRTSYRSDVVVSNTTGSDLSGLRLYHGLDCYLAGNDLGTGAAYTWPTTATSRVGCVGGGGRSMRLVSQSAGNGYYEDDYLAVWNHIRNQLALPNTINPLPVDNGIAVDWAFSLPANGSVIRTFLTEFVNAPIWIPLDTDLLDRVLG